MNLTFDPLDPILLLFEGVYLGAAVLLLFFSVRVKSEWVRASLAGLAWTTLAWRLLAVIPSWWLYYAEGRLQWGGQGCVELDMSCLKQTIKDSIVVIQNGIIIAAFTIAFLIWQKRNPKQLAPGEQKPEATFYR